MQKAEPLRCLALRTRTGTGTFVQQVQYIHMYLMQHNTISDAWHCVKRTSVHVQLYSEIALKCRAGVQLNHMLRMALVVSQIRLVPSTWSCSVQVPRVSEHSSLPPQCPGVYSALPHQMRRCFTVSFRGDIKSSVPGNNLRIFQTLVSHYYSGKPERVT